MKKILYFITCATVAAVSLVACNPEEKKDKPDGVAAIESFTLTKAANDFLDIDLVAVIDNDTIRIPAPKKDDGPVDSAFVPTIKLSKGDVLTVVDTLDNASAYEETFSFKFSDRVSFVVSDESVTPAVTKRYGIAFLDNDRKAALTSFVFAKDDNNGLEEDYKVDDFDTPTLSISLPKAVNGQSLTATVSASINDEITINKEAVANGGKISINTAFPVDIEVNDKVTGEKTTYVIRFSKQSADLISVSKIGSYAPTDLQAWVTMAIDGNTPYVAYYAGDASATRYAYAAKFENGEFTQVGGAISERTNAVYIDSFGGNVYIMYMDYPGTPAQAFTVKKLKGNEWSLVGDRSKANVRSTGLYPDYKQSFIINPANGYPMTAVTANAADTNLGLIKRGSAVGIYDGSAWTISTGPCNSTDMWYTPRFARSTDAVYLLYGNQSKKTYSLFKYSGGSWSVVIDNWSAGGLDLGTTSLALQCDNNGDVYAAVASNATGEWTCSLYKFADAQAIKAYNSIPGLKFGNTDAIFDFIFDKDNNPIVVAVSETKELKVLVEDPDTKTWAAAATIESAVAGKQLAIEKDGNNNVYIAAVGTEGGNAINLYKVSYK
ncbi:MAG: hypothetical protein IJS07_06340 [Bacteroidales bacterium]|nr:hypothetical protein [Bacteroidales bacterium]